MNAKRQGKRNQDQKHAVADSTVESDFTVTYALNEYQRGSLVLRFPTQPDRNAMLRALAAYGIPAGNVSDVSATPVRQVGSRVQPTPQATRPQTNESTWLPNQPTSRASTPTQRRQERSMQATPQGTTTKATTRRKNPTFALLIFVAVTGFIFSAFTASDSYDRGRLAYWMASSSGEGIAATTSACWDRLTTYAEQDAIITGEDAGFFSDRVSTFPVHPANAAFMLGCVTGG